MMRILSCLWTVISITFQLVNFTFSSTSHILSSLADVDFQRIKADHHYSPDTNEITLPSVSLRRGLTGTGYHRELVTNIEVEGVRVFPDNRVLLIENVTPDIYVDIDQVLSMADFGGPQILSSARMDTEKPASLSESHVVLIYSYLINNKMDLNFPIHFRYQPPSPNLTYIPVIIPEPMVFLAHPLGSAAFPCHPHTRDTCPWALVTDEDRERALTVMIPCGLNNSVSYVVAVITVMTTLIATFIILCMIYGMEIYSF